jgi:universal stress protein E
MPGFHKILVGVDFTKSKETGGAVLDPVGEHAFRQARWLAHASHASLTILSAWAPDGNAPEEAARYALSGLVGQATDQGIEARGILVPGQGWFEIVRQVQHDGHDLVVVGTHDPRGLKRLLLGSTARKLLHDCPCPVWVCKPGHEIPPRNILVATDLSPLSDEVVRVGLGIGRLAGAQTHVLDVIEFPLDRLWSPTSGDSVTRKYHVRVRGEAEVALHAQIERSEGNQPKATVTIHVADGDGIPDHAIVKFIDDHAIDLLVLGTVARHGLSGFVLGNTAERLLPEVPCSVLAIKPADFGKKRSV